MSLFSKQSKPSQSKDDSLSKANNLDDTRFDIIPGEHLLSAKIEDTDAGDMLLRDFVKKYGKEVAANLLTKLPSILLLLFFSIMVLRISTINRSDSYIVSADGPPIENARTEPSESNPIPSPTQHSEDMTSSHNGISPHNTPQIRPNTASKQRLIYPKLDEGANVYPCEIPIPALDLSEFKSGETVLIYFSGHGTAQNTPALNISTGDRVLISSSGFVETGVESGLSGPGGIPFGERNIDFTKNNLINDFNHGALLYRIGTQDVWKPYDIQHIPFFTSTHDGPLEFSINDNDLSDNVGAYEVTVRVIKNKKNNCNE